MSETLESVLIRKAIGGDDVAVTVLLANVRERMRRRIAGIIPPDLQSTVDADDIVQEAQVEVFRHIRTFEARGEDSFFRWATTIAVRRLRNAIKARRSLKRGGAAVPRTTAGSPGASVVALLELMAGPEKTPSRQAAGHEATRAMEEAMDYLPEHYRQAVRLVYLDGCSVAEAATAMGKSPRAVHNLCFKAKRQLRAVLGSASKFLSSD